MALCDRLPTAPLLRPCRNHAPAASANRIIARTGIRSLFFPEAWATDAEAALAEEENCAGTTVSAEAEPLAPAASCAGPEASAAAELETLAGGAGVAAALRPESVSRFNLCRSARKWAECW